MTPEAIGVDIGGTKIAALRVAADGTVHASQTRETPADDAEAMVATMIEAAAAVRTDGTVAVGVGAPGLVDGEGLVRYGPNMALRDVSLNDLVGGALGLPCTTENDATAATWGEYVVGAGQGSPHLLVITVGTGIGGGIVTDGSIMRGAHGFAGEVGHVIVEPGGPRCGCGNHGCWEQVASGAAIARAGREAVARLAHSVIGELAGGDPDRATGTTVTEAARRGDPAALGILTEVGHRLGEGLAGLANVLDPDRIVVGGGAVDAGDLLLEPARAAFGRAIEAPDHRPSVPIVPAMLGNDAGGVGAALLALDALG